MAVSHSSATFLAAMGQRDTSETEGLAAAVAHPVSSIVQDRGDDTWAHTPSGRSARNVVTSGAAIRHFQCPSSLPAQVAVS